MNVANVITRWKKQGQPLDVAGANTYIWRMGKGETVVCIHGVPASGFLYRKMLPELAKRGFEGVTLDLIGLGLADRPEHFDYSWSGLASWYVQALNAAGIKDFHLVVHDIGGPIGFDVIRRIPDRVKSLTVLNTMVNVSTFHRPWSMEPFAWPVIGKLWLQSAKTPMFFALLRMQGMKDITLAEANTYGQLLLGSDNGSAFLKIMRGFERTAQFELAIKSTLAARQFPAQVIWGKDDPALPHKKYVPDLLNALNLDRFHLVSGKHFVAEDAYREIAQLIAELTQQLKK